MKKAEIKKSTHVVFKIDDIKKYLTKEQLSNLLDIQTTILLNRKVDGKKVNDYYVINELVKEVHQTAVEHGWWEEPKTFGELIALIHSEASEALEEFRNGHDPKETYYTKDKQGNDKPEGIPSELADIVIRVFDLCGYYGIDIAGMLFEKSEYNKSRPYKHGGKKI